MQVLEIRPRSVYQLPVGSRVCTVWSSAYICLFPGTIVSPDEPLPKDHVLVELKDASISWTKLSFKEVGSRLKATINSNPSLTGKIATNILSKMHKSEMSFGRHLLPRLPAVVLGHG